MTEIELKREISEIKLQIKQLKEKEEKYKKMQKQLREVYSKMLVANGVICNLEPELRAYYKTESAEANANMEQIGNVAEEFKGIGNIFNTKLQDECKKMIQQIELKITEKENEICRIENEIAMLAEEE